MKPNLTGEEMSFGQQVAGLTLNASGDPKVQKVEELCADLLDLLNDYKNAKQVQPYQAVLFNHAIMQILGAQMYAVKVLTLNN